MATGAGEGVGDCAGGLTGVAGEGGSDRAGGLAAGSGEGRSDGVICSEGGASGKVIDSFDGKSICQERVCCVSWVA